MSWNWVSSEVNCCCSEVTLLTQFCRRSSLLAMCRFNESSSSHTQHHHSPVISASAAWRTRRQTSTFQCHRRHERLPHLSGLTSNLMLIASFTKKRISSGIAYVYDTMMGNRCIFSLVQKIPIVSADRTV